MVRLFNFMPDGRKPLKEFAKPHGQVPKFWKGYIALFKPNDAPKKTKFYSAYWFASKQGKRIKKAILINENN